MDSNSECVLAYSDTADSNFDKRLAPSGPVSYRDHYVSYRRTLCGVQYTLAKFQWNSLDYDVNQYFACPNNAAQDPCTLYRPLYWNRHSANGGRRALISYSHQSRIQHIVTYIEPFDWAVPRGYSIPDQLQSCHINICTYTSPAFRRCEFQNSQTFIWYLQTPLSFAFSPSLLQFLSLQSLRRSCHQADTKPSLVPRYACSPSQRCLGGM